MNEVTLMGSLANIISLGLWLALLVGMFYSFIQIHLENNKYEDHDTAHFSGNAKNAYPISDEKPVKKAS